MERFPSQPPQEENPTEQNNAQEKSQYSVGVKKNPDGSLDYSKAASFEPGEKHRVEMLKLEEARKEVRAKMLEIPADVQHGTAERVWYDLRNTTFIGRERQERTEPYTLQRKNEEKRTAKFEIEQSILDNLFRREGSDRKAIITESLLASLEDNFIDQYEKLKSEKKEFASDGNGNFRSVADLLESAKSLRSRLIEEMNRQESSKTSEKELRLEEDMKALKAKVAYAKQTLESGFNDHIRLDKLKLAENDTERWQKLAVGLEEIRKKYVKDNRLRQVKNPEYKSEVEVLLSNI